MTNEEIEAELSRAKAEGMNRRDRKKYKRELENPGRDSDGRPSWYDEKKHGKWKSRYSDVYSAYMEVLGREPESMQMLSGWGGLSYDRLLRLISTSDEARSRGVDPADYGNEVVDPETLSGSRREWYDAWQEYHPGETFYSGLWDHLDGIKDVGNINFYRALEEGSVIKDPNNLYVITPRALEQYNSENDNRIVIYGTNAGVPVIAPKDADIEWHNVDSFSNDDFSEYVSGAYGGQFGDTEFAMRSTTGNPTSGLMDAARDFAGDLGIGRDLFDVGAATVSPMFAAPALSRVGLGDQAYFITDPLGITSGIMYGSEGMQRNATGGADLFDADVEDVQKAQGVGQAVVQFALNFVPGVGTALSIGFGALRNANQAAAGTQSWGDAFVQTGIAAATSYFAPGGDGIGAAFQTAALQGASGTLSAMMTRDPDTGERMSFGDALERGAISAVSSLATSGFNAAINNTSFAPTTRTGGFLQGSAVGAGTSYLTGLALGTDPDDLGWNVAQGAITGGISGAVAAEKRNDFYNKKDPITGMTGYETASASAMQWGPPASGDMPLTRDAGAWAGVRNWATDWNPGPPRGWDDTVRFGNWAWDRATPWETGNETAAREQRELRERFNIRGYREPSSFSIPDDWARDPFEGIGYEPQGNFRLRLGA